MGKAAQAGNYLGAGGHNKIPTGYWTTCSRSLTGAHGKPVACPPAEGAVDMRLPMTRKELVKVPNISHKHRRQVYVDAAFCDEQVPKHNIVGTVPVSPCATRNLGTDRFHDIFRFFQWAGSHCIC